MMDYARLNDILQVISDHASFLILIHDKPDGDAVGSGMALALFLQKLDKTCAVLAPCAVPRRLAFLKKETVTCFAGAEELRESGFTYDCILSVDVASDELIDRAAFAPHEIAFAIDHHRVNTLTAAQKYVDPTAAAAGEILFSLFSMYTMITGQSDIFDKPLCEALYASIASDTGCFKYGNTTEQSHDIAAKLFSIGIEAEEINRRLFDIKTPSQLAVERLALSGLELFYEDRLAIVTIDLSDLEAIGAAEEDTETVSQLARMVEGVQIGVLMREKRMPDGKTGYKFSVRSNVDTDVSELCALFGGGGHQKAAGCTIFADRDMARERFIAKAKAFLV